MSLKQHLVQFVRDERGQSTTEYILILSVVVMIAMKFRGLLSSSLQKLMGQVESDMLEASGGGQ